MSVNTQHPDNGDPAVTNFPAPLDGTTVPRDCSFVITRKNGGVTGSWIPVSAADLVPVFNPSPMVVSCLGARVRLLTSEPRGARLAGPGGR